MVLHRRNAAISDKRLEPVTGWDLDFCKVRTPLRLRLSCLIICRKLLSGPSNDPISSHLQVDQATLFEMILAANYLDIKPMLDLTCKTVAEMIRGKTPEEIRKHFNIKNDFTPEEEEQVCLTLWGCSMIVARCAAAFMCACFYIHQLFISIHIADCVPSLSDVPTGAQRERVV
jgi:hypothetical protein